MVVTPKQVLKITAGEKEQISRLEKQIDSVLKSEFIDGADEICYDIPKKVTERVIKTIQRMYQNAGWKVTYESDQRDGDYLRFKLK